MAFYTSSVLGHFQKKTRDKIYQVQNFLYWSKIVDSKLSQFGFRYFWLFLYGTLTLVYIFNTKVLILLDIEIYISRLCNNRWQNISNIAFMNICKIWFSFWWSWNCPFFVTFFTFELAD